MVPERYASQGYSSENHWRVSYNMERGWCCTYTVQAAQSTALQSLMGYVDMTGCTCERHESNALQPRGSSTSWHAACLQ